MLNLNIFVHRFHWRFRSQVRRQLSIVSQFYPPDFAATGQLLHDLSTYLSSQSYSVYVHTSLPSYAYDPCQETPPTTQFYSSNLRVSRSRTTNFFPFSILGKSLKGLLYVIRVFFSLVRRSRRGDVVLLTTEPPFLPLFAPFLRLLGSPRVVILSYDTYPQILVDLGLKGPGSIIIKVWLYLLNISLKLSSHLIVLSQPMKDYFLSQFNLPNEFVTVIPSWSIIPTYSHPSATESSSNPVSPSVLKVGYSGNFGRCHDFATVLAAIPRIHTEQLPIKFFFQGSGIHFGRLVRLKELNPDFNLTLQGYVPLESLSSMLSSFSIALVTQHTACSCTVAPSKFYGHIALGTPILLVAPKDSYLRDLLERHELGVWVPPGDVDRFVQALFDLYRNTNLLQQYSKNCLTFHHAFCNRDKIFESYSKVLFSHEAS